MKKLLAILTCSLLVTALYGQPKPPAKPALTPQQQAALLAAQNKPKGPSPYVLKKDYEEMMAKMAEQVKVSSDAANSLKHVIGSKNQEINTLNAQMKQVVDVLNSTNFKIALTSDSLHLTAESVNDVQKNSETRFTELKQEIDGLKSRITMLWIALILLALAPVVIVFVMMNKKLKDLSGLVKLQNGTFESKMREFEHQNAEALKAEALNTRHMVDREVGAAKHDFLKRLRADVELLATEITAIKEGTSK